MTIRTIPRTAVGGSIKLMRLPLDMAVALLPGNGSGPKPAAGLALDRAEAQLRDIAGAALGDEVLREDAARRRVAADERERALRLRAAAARRTAEADEVLSETREEAEQRREEAGAEARHRRAEAERLRKKRAQEAAQAERKRKSANHKALSKAEQEIEEKADDARLSQLQQDAEVLEQKAEALTAEAEAHRLQDEATKKKAARKSA
ncbi:MAG TPA: hypothetical protein VMY78_12480 [Solirubrobacteraceae bacterium]|nr:hypothetical protein [Solirubrobacteraceae bacterium]